MLAIEQKEVSAAPNCQRGPVLLGGPVEVQYLNLRSDLLWRPQHAGHGGGSVGSQPLYPALNTVDCFAGLHCVASKQPSPQHRYEVLNTSGAARAQTPCVSERCPVCF